jgi:putative NIF3 family GTP cyclohydrolase 1 type 2
MTTIGDIVRHVESLTGHQLNRDEGVLHGTAETEVTSATVCWMASPDAIEFSGARGNELLICHESLYQPYDVLLREKPPEGWESWYPNKRRRELLDEYNLTCLRIHGSADQLYIYDRFAELLELGEGVSGEGMCKVFEIPECTFAELMAHVKRCMGIEAVRVCDGGNPQRKVKRIGIPWGGVSQFTNVGYQERVRQLGCDAFIGGESDCYAFRFAIECGIAMIETSHEGSENPGLVQFTEMLTEAFPEVGFEFYENECIWRIV